MLFPIQTMKFFPRTARGDSVTFMGGRGKVNPLQGLCRGNGAGPACWLMLSSVLMPDALLRETRFWVKNNISNKWRHH
jgi:hypothetical protein